MHYTQLPPGLPPFSVLGFGCAGLAGRVGRRQSNRAIAVALAAGITHFDVARTYGYGEAETILGDNLRGLRDKVVIATKFGIEPPRVARAAKIVKPLAQIAVSFCTPPSSDCATYHCDKHDKGAFFGSIGALKRAFASSTPTISISSSCTMPHFRT